MKTEINKVEVHHNSLGAPAPGELSAIEKLTNGIEKIAHFFNHVSHKVSSVLLFLLMCVTTVDVIGRNIFNNPITGSYELTGLMLAMMIFFSLGMAQLKRDHIEIDFLTKKLPLKVQAGLNAITSLILSILMALTTWQLIEFTKRMFTGNYLSGELGFPIYIVTALATVGVLFFTLTILLDMLQSILKVVQKNES
ncbi:TRAP-type C4-dicarboxylate transport system permease small subunit [Bacillus oleivorans]|uniref:TRAP-type C4-dicarboxylate transport system permease small subunit n=1 Tax=Bacillus oleivorans TaxID=1448271 RepID=A0A285CNW9_9BACI|nr:TRAP transporter small permease [Bacillus oleivorans]SNX68748.1 TRAP-type C4-dicarboxylate transport system permease small subunit [Bacillus oleivorans]